jgi:phage terminase small subunit
LVLEKSKPIENTIGKGGRPAGLTNRQREFAKYYVEGKYSNAECARKAGYAENSATNHAVKMLDGKSFPEVPELIKELREARERRYGVTVLGQLKRFEELSMSAEEAGQFSAAINAEKIRSSLGGLTIDRRESTHVHQLDNMSREDIVARLASLRKNYPHAFADMKRVEDASDRTITVEAVETKPAQENTLRED